MDDQVRKSLNASLALIEMNVNLLRTALSKTPMADNETLSNERASLVVSESLNLLESITLSLEDIGQPIENELKKIAKESYANLQSSLNLCASLPDVSIKEPFQEISKKLKKIEEGHQERRHSRREPAKLCSTILCD